MQHFFTETTLHMVTNVVSKGCIINATFFERHFVEKQTVSKTFNILFDGILTVFTKFSEILVSEGGNSP